MQILFIVVYCVIYPRNTLKSVIIRDLSIISQDIFLSIASLRAFITYYIVGT